MLGWTNSGSRAKETAVSMLLFISFGTSALSISPSSTAKWKCSGPKRSQLHLSARSWGCSNLLEHWRMVSPIWLMPKQFQWSWWKPTTQNSLKTDMLHSNLAAKYSSSTNVCPKSISTWIIRPTKVSQLLASKKQLIGTLNQTKGATCTDNACWTLSTRIQPIKPNSTKVLTNTWLKSILGWFSRLPASWIIEFR